MSDVFTLAEKIDARLLLTGDRKQHGSVERGAALRILEEEAGIKPAEVKEIQRQTDAYKAAVKSLSDGKVSEGFAQLDALGWVREIASEDRYLQMAADYVDAVKSGQTALVVSPTHSEGHRITAEIRDALRKSKAISGEEREFCTLENARLTEAERTDAINYAPGDVLQFHQNTKGFQRGQRITVADAKQLPLTQAARFQVFHSATLRLSKGDRVRITHNGMTADGQHRLDNGSLYTVKSFDRTGNIVLKENNWTISKDFGHIEHGYVVTSHASQGKSVERVLIGQSSASFPASSREQFYVSVSRGSKQATIYTDSKAALREAVGQTDERVSATELVNKTATRQIVARQQELDRISALQRPRERLPAVTAKQATATTKSTRPTISARSAGYEVFANERSCSNFVAATAVPSPSIIPGWSEQNSTPRKESRSTSAASWFASPVETWTAKHSPTSAFSPESSATASPGFKNPTNQRHTPPRKMPQSSNPLT
jgi:hypothetical protein